MKTIRKLLAVMALGMLVSQPVLAGTPQPDTGLAAFAFNGATDDVQALSPGDMADTQGRIWALPLAIVGTDLALAGFFWGVYLPHYGGGATGVFTLYASH